jgi:hypothetical protein
MPHILDLPTSNPIFCISDNTTPANIPYQRSRELDKTKCRQADDVFDRCHFGAYIPKPFVYEIDAYQGQERPKEEVWDKGK